MIEQTEDFSILTMAISPFFRSLQDYVVFSGLDSDGVTWIEEDLVTFSIKSNDHIASSLLTHDSLTNWFGTSCNEFQSEYGNLHLTISHLHNEITESLKDNGMYILNDMEDKLVFIYYNGSRKEIHAFLRLMLCYNISIISV